MVFTSWAFALFFAVVLLGLRLLRSRQQRQLWLLLASSFFYAYSEAWYLLLLATPSVIDYVCSIRIEDTADERARKRWVVFSVVSNLGLLGYFKYANFFVESVDHLVGAPVGHLDIVLPIGISFYTFKTLSYTIDVYRRELKACRNWLQYAMFVTYFPELVAGPIVRASVFLPQMGRSLKPSWRRSAVGCQIILLGLTKKVLVADRLAAFVDAIFAHPRAYDSSTVLTAVVAYSLQIYFDFSGYSDMAIGLSRIIGFDLPENFNMPYISTSITEFWRRWHMTLSSWLRDYLYIPLGGNRKGRWRTYLNLFLTMLLGGLWHGAGWTFVFWGFLHGVGLTVHKAWIAFVPRTNSVVRDIFGWLVTYAFVCVGWIFFRATDFRAAVVVLRKVTWLDPTGIHFTYLPFFLLLPIVIMGHLIGIAAARAKPMDPRTGRRIEAPAWANALYARSRTPFAVRPHPAAGLYVLLPLPGFAGGFLLAVWLIIVYLFSALNTSPFIYFQF